MAENLNENNDDTKIETETESESEENTDMETENAVNEIIDIIDTADSSDQSDPDINETETDADTDTDLEIPEIELTQEMVDAEYFLPEEEKQRAAVWLFDWIEIFSSALLTVILLFTFIFRLVTVQGPSMQETLHEKENLIISNLFYSPKQGDIVVIQVPNPNFPTPIIKRVIAVEGQTVDFDFENWIVYVDGEPIYEIDGKAAIEPYVNYEEGRFMSGGENIINLPLTIEKGKIFVMGDNRNHSSDSRSSSIGQVDVRNVVGRVLIRVFPFDKFGVVKPDES